ncbi:MAG TPA: electron transfer flavoprotein subunit alpha/FixB family protein [bacterium]|nr:electron transfer flavoprotein subunit alpha/FixB family protein [bacterium]HQB10867.1 electron transfer flavoprotein subunit alpha/FixB family protein [bacterium]HQM83647.1 electron transfer flavoprotein subunit alpha/FixB family protein [bacterium]
MMKALVFIEKNTHTDMLRNVTAELTWKAHSLVNPLNGEVVGIFAGDKLPQDHDELFKYGMDRILYFNHPQLKNLQSIAMKNILTEMVKSENADIVLFGATHTGRDVAPLIASTLRTGLTADCTQLYIDEYKESGKILYQVRPAFGGNILATIITPYNRPMMATVREGVMLLPEVKLDNPAKLQEFRTEFKMEWIKNEFLEIIPKVSKVNFGEANIIVAGGAGVGCRENFRLLEQLAAVLNAEVGASRAAVDFGFAEKERQIGQTGSVVRPKLYIACGISGSIQHRAGMEESKKIIAINSDPNAPIFNIAHMGIVGDLKEIIPVMIKYLREE